MRASLFILAGAIMLGAAVPVSNVSAQGVSIEGPGVGVRVGEPDRYRERHIYGERRTVGEGCRSVTVRKRLPDGSVVVRRRSTC